MKYGSLANLTSLMTAIGNKLKERLDWATYSKLGAKNQLRLSMFGSSYTDNGVTVTPKADRSSMSIFGRPSGGAPSFTIVRCVNPDVVDVSQLGTDDYFIVDDYTFLGELNDSYHSIVLGGNKTNMILDCSISYSVKFVDPNGVGADVTRTGVLIDYTSDTSATTETEYYYIDLSNIPSGYVFADGSLILTVSEYRSSTFANDAELSFMIIPEDADSSYSPYAMTNAELTDKNSKLANAQKVVTKAVDLTNWTQDTTSQSGTTLYKKQIALNHVYANPSVDIGAASGSVLPTIVQQTAYDLIEYVTADDTVPCIYLYASAIPSDAFYIDIEGAD